MSISPSRQRTAVLPMRFTPYATCAAILVCGWLVCLVAGGVARADLAAEHGRVRIQLADGRIILADRTQQSSDGEHIVALIERPGIVVSCRLSRSEIRSIERLDSHGPGAPSILDPDRQHDTHAADGPHPKVLPNSAAVRAGVESASAVIEPARVEGVRRTGATATGHPLKSAGASVRVEPAGAVPRMVFHPVRGWYLDLEARTVGVRDEPLSAYVDDVRRVFPYGVPIDERGFVRDLMRSLKVRDVLAFPPPASVPEGEAVRKGEAATTGVGRRNLQPPRRPGGGLFFEGMRTDHRRIDRIQVHAEPVSLGGGVDVNALELVVRAFDVEGRPSPFVGTLNVTLWGHRAEVARVDPERLGVRPGRTERLQTWTVRLREPHTAGSLVLRLPLAHPLPEHDPARFGLGVVQASLAIPGQGVFDATEAGIPLRQLDPWRAHNVAEFGSPFLPGELTSGSKRRVGRRFRPSSSLRPDRRVFTVKP